jgi:hypothetical protein
MSQSIYSIDFSEEKKFSGFNARIIFTPDLEKFIEETFGGFFEVEFMQGEKVTLEGGEIEYRFNCSKEKEMEIAAQFHKEKFGKGGRGPSVN